MTETTDWRLTHLSSAATRLGHAFARPKTMAVMCVVLLTALGWLYLGALAARMDLGWPQALVAFCGPLSFHESAAADLALSLSMWSAMIFAMMLPSAGPMIFTYAEIADTAARKGDIIVSPFVLALGYALVWLTFAACIALTQIVLVRMTLLASDGAATSDPVSGAILIVAGLYQFSATKQACLMKCRHPFAFFFTNWRTTARGVFGLGVRQGLYCLGCCWAMMLVMLAVGAMNVIWMAVLGAVMTIEKMSAGRRISGATGIALIIAGVAVAELS